MTRDSIRTIVERGTREHITVIPNPDGLIIDPDAARITIFDDHACTSFDDDPIAASLAILFYRDQAIMLRDALNAALGT